MIRAVVDTNVWVSALLNPAGPPARVLDAFARGAFVAVVPDAVLSEIRDVLGRERIRRRFALAPPDAEELVRIVAARAEVVATRDDDLKRDADLIAKMSAAGVAITSVSAFLRLLET